MLAFSSNHCCVSQSSYCCFRLQCLSQKHVCINKYISQEKKMHPVYGACSSTHNLNVISLLMVMDHVHFYIMCFIMYQDWEHIFYNHRLKKTTLTRWKLVFSFFWSLRLYGNWNRNIMEFICLCWGSYLFTSYVDIYQAHFIHQRKRISPIIIPLMCLNYITQDLYLVIEN